MLFTTAVLTREFILSKVRQEDIFEHFTHTCIELDTLVCSPIRDDASPTCTYKWINGKLYLKDWSGHFGGDCFDLVQKLYNCKYHTALEIVANEFKILDYSIPYEKVDLTTIPKNRERSKISVKWKEWDEYLLSYWNQFGITREWLDYFKIAPVENVWVNGDLKYNYRQSDPAFCYYFSENESKIYFPMRGKGEMRFLVNTRCLQGYDQLPNKGDQLVIIKSYKDVVALRKFGNIYSVAPQAESVTLNEEEYEDLSSRFKRLYIMYDFDYAGIKTANKTRKLYPKIQPLFLTNGRFNTYDYGAKDPADYIKKELPRQENINKLIKTFKNL